ncbi:L-galactose dehydrogenase [Colletotrichum lupini]|uniref:L-galactose dehydrogenase n=1 Tax=Colletotrichum lupini TaxID=145971 RepID=A0A9Q8WK26_9PEZI|nr:L-galactose dehydrogenase [Colletotrichum lupini]UQC85687.1 L-galactose dehydrogenase [Colletotrichum lupini]
MATTTSLNPASRPSIAPVLPPLFLGTATFNTQHVKDPLQMPYRQIVSRALELGVNGFDTSPYYGPSEVLLGDALAAHTAATNIPRESYVLVTKAGRIAGNEFDYSPAYVRYSVLRSLSRLNTTYLDLVYMHDVEFVSPAEVLAAVQTLRQLRDEGKIRYVGISGFPVHVLCSLAEMILAETGEALDAILSYGHFTIQNPTLGLAEVVAGPDHNDEQSPLRRFRNAGVQVVLNASMLGMGLLTSTGVPARTETAEGKAGVIASWHPAPDDLRSACQKLSAIASDAGERLETVALHWSMEEYARVGAAAGLGVQLPGQSGDVRVGGSVMGVTSTAELEQTVESWKLVLQGLAAGSEASARYEKLKALVEQKMWPELGVWKGYSWASPDEGFQNERSADKFGLIPEEDELMTNFMTRISSNFDQHLIGQYALAHQPPWRCRLRNRYEAHHQLRRIIGLELNHKARSPRPQPDRIFAILPFSSTRMAEAFGLVASVFATIQIADRVVSICKDYIENVRDAPSDLRTILVECSSVGAVLQNVEFLLKFEEPYSALRKALDGDAGPVAECHGAIEQLEKLIASDQNQAQGPTDSKRKKVQVTLRNLAWPLKETKAKKQLQDVARCKNTISLALTATSSHDIKLIREGTSRIQQVLTENQRNDVYKWLRHTDPSSIHYFATKRSDLPTCIPTTTELAQITNLERANGCHVLQSGPSSVKEMYDACGFMASREPAKLSWLHNSLRKSKRIADSLLQDESAPFLRWVLERMCRKVDQVPDHLWTMFKDGKDPSLSDLLTALEAVSRYFSGVHITIDAVDESSPREELLKVLRDLATDLRFSNIRLLVTSREYLDIEKVMEEVSTEISMRNEYLDADIRLYTESRLATNDKLKDWTEDVRQEALEALCIGAKGMFRWIVCQLDSLRRIKGSKAAIMNELRNPPKTLDEAYDRIFETMPEEDLQIVVSALDWICFNNKVFGRDWIDSNVLIEAIQKDLSRQSRCAKDYRYDVEFLRELCGCLITVTADVEFDFCGGLEISFSHYTVMEYLATSIGFSPECCFRLDKSTALSERASIISSEAFQYKIGETRTLENHRTSPTLTWQFDFGTYCSLAVMKMIRDCEDVLLQNEELAIMLTTSHHSRTHPFDTIHNMELIEDGEPVVEIFLGSHLIGFLYLQAFKLADSMLRKEGCAGNLLQTIVHMGYRFDFEESIQNFHLPLMSFLAATGSESFMGEALHHLLTNWHEAIDFRCLLLDFVALHGHEEYREYPLSALPACIEMCRLEELLDLGAETDASDFVVTPLQVAVACLDQDGVVILLEGGANPDARGNPAAMNRPEHTILRACDYLSGMTPLQICRYKTQKPCLKALLDCGGIFQGFVNDRLENIEEISGRIEAMLLKYGAT